MKCPKCNAEVKKGSLYCDRCLAEIPWVKEFNSIETLMEKKKREEKTGHLSRVREKTWKKTGVLITVFILAVLLFGWRQLNTFSALYQRGEQAYQNGDYDAALSLAEKALDKNPDHLKANLLRAKILEAEGDFYSAILVMQPVISKNSDSVSAYKMMVRLLYHEGRTSEIKKLLADCEDEEILDACGEYIAKEPVSGLKGGTYTSRQTIELMAEDETIYYTLDGTRPTRDSLTYSAPITLLEGTTVLKAMAVNQKGMASDVVTWKYVVVDGVPDPPTISPKDGNYYSETRIILDVPDGCVAYYAFDDEEPDANSTQYTNPITMPEGYHEFYAVAVSANGEVSEIVSRIYYLQY